MQRKREGYKKIHDFLTILRDHVFQVCGHFWLIKFFSDPDVSIVKPLSADASAHAQSILAFLANSYKQRKINVGKVFASLDPKGTGLVPKDVVSLFLIIAHPPPPPPSTIHYAPPSVIEHVWYHRKSSCSIKVRELGNANNVHH